MTGRETHYSGPWVCFHCGESFGDWLAAQRHFGGTQGALAACKIKAGKEFGLLLSLRAAEADLADARKELDRLRIALRDAEAQGYDRGIRDMNSRAEALANGEEI